MFYKPVLTLEQRDLKMQAEVRYVNSRRRGSIFFRVEPKVAASQCTHIEEQEWPRQSVGPFSIKKPLYCEPIESRGLEGDNSVPRT